LQTPSDTRDPAADLPLFDRFPALRRLPRARLCDLPSPVQHLSGIGGTAGIWIKRDDMSAPECGGNKVRALEFLLGGLRAGDTVVTVGGAGSTHVLATALHAGRIGVTTIALRWKHDMNPVADIVAARIGGLIADSPVGRSTMMALARARIRAARGRLRYIPLGGSTALGTLGHVNAALELAGQIARGEAPIPDKIVLPVGAGGTAAGLLLGFTIAGLRIEIVGARVGPGMFVNRRRVIGVARRTSELIRRLTGERPPAVDPEMLRMAHHVYGGAYGRALAGASAAANILHDAAGIRLDDTYSAKAWVAALDESRGSGGRVLFWLTFDATCLTS